MNVLISSHELNVYFILQLVRAEDAGKLSTTATVNVKVTDINDKNPEFTDSDVPYVFKVKEGNEIESALT